ncbi:CHC2 zinc finger domain-containing protein [Immundisolibacter cernigliae]|uniref:CHC2 zinc finger domain-containing protein n=1 Tax=Immundisolibacter cernigliae TaxID=1810504 RepID=UPI00096AD2EE
MAAGKNPAHGGGRGGAYQWSALYGGRSDSRGEFRRDLLPEPLGYYAAEGIRLSGRGAWRDAVCPFHQDTRPSLRVHSETGGFKCMACGASGGDVLSFHRRRHVMGFVEAAKALGAWSVL